MEKRRFRLKIGGKKICGNGISEMEGKKMCQLICGNVVAEMEGNKKRIVAMELSKIGGERERERERELSRLKKIFWILILKSTHILILSVCQ